jgi:hypothetical protein
MIALASCGPQHQTQAPTNNKSAPILPAPSAPPGVANGALREAKVEMPPAEPKGRVDPKSAQAAGEVVQHYGALIEQGRWEEAERLWGDAAAARDFATALRAEFSEVHLEIGELGGSEGAAGSIYVSEQVAFYGKDQGRKDQKRAAEVTLRRVNDVPGSTEKQRQWHIERIDLKDRP